tara:strand:+ start:70 stop:1206 length:1137 start_codon:yes stop_codon:yes gene_type:complete
VRQYCRLKELKSAFEKKYQEVGQEEISGDYDRKELIETFTLNTLSAEAKKYRFNNSKGLRQALESIRKNGEVHKMLEEHLSECSKKVLGTQILNKQRKDLETTRKFYEATYSKICQAHKKKSTKNTEGACDIKKKLTPSKRLSIVGGGTTPKKKRMVKVFFTSNRESKSKILVTENGRSPWSSFMPWAHKLTEGRNYSLTATAPGYEPIQDFKFICCDRNKIEIRIKRSGLNMKVKEISPREISITITFIKISTKDPKGLPKDSGEQDSCFAYIADSIIMPRRRTSASLPELDMVKKITGIVSTQSLALTNGGPLEVGDVFHSYLIVHIGKDFVILFPTITSPIPNRDNWLRESSTKNPTPLTIVSRVIPFKCDIVDP